MYFCPVTNVRKVRVAQNNSHFCHKLPNSQGIMSLEITPEESKPSKPNVTSSDYSSFDLEINEKF